MNATQTLPLVAISTWSSGGTPSRSNDANWNGTIPWISAATLKGSRIVESDQHLTEAGLRAGSNLAPEGATLVLVRGMALHRETRIGLARLPVSFNQDVKALFPKAGIVPDFLLYALQARSSQIRELVSSAGSGTGVLNTQLLQRLPIWVPSQEVQRAVVEAISDADSLIESLERFIAKKKAIKQGIQQQLLTGRTRLPGYDGIWRDSTIGSLAQVAGGGTPSTRVDSFWGGEVPWFTPAEIKTEGAGLVSSSERTITQEGLANSAAALLPPGTVLVTSRASIGNCAVAAVPLSTNQGFASMIPKDSRSTWFLYYWVQQYRSELESRAAGSTFLEISASKVATIPFRQPDLDEQAAIGMAIRDADAEVDALARRLTKARAIKQGMMQQLLTGRTQLLVEVEA